MPLFVAWRVSRVNVIARLVFDMRPHSVDIRRVGIRWSVGTLVTQSTIRTDVLLGICENLQYTEFNHQSSCPCTHEIRT